jgi:hypothetical protein
MRVCKILGVRHERILAAEHAHLRATMASRAESGSSRITICGASAAVY